MAKWKSMNMPVHSPLLLSVYTSVTRRIFRHNVITLTHVITCDRPLLNERVSLLCIEYLRDLQMAAM